MLKKALPFFSLFTSVGTLICCALPALFVSLGLGATFAAVLGVFPQLIWFSEHKALVFSVAGILLVIAGIARKKGAALACPTDPALGDACKTTRDAGSVIFYLSIACYVVGGFFAFLAQYLI